MKCFSSTLSTNSKRRQTVVYGNKVSSGISVPKAEGVVRNRTKLRNEELGKMPSSNVLGLQKANEVNGT